MIADLNEDAGKKVVQCQPDSLKFHRTDVSREDSWKSLVEATKASFGRIDCLVNNAGTTHSNQVRVLIPHDDSWIDRFQPSLSVTEADFDKCFNVNVKGIFFSIRHVLPVLLEQGDGGSIVNVASVGATRPRPGLVWYNSSKGAVTNVLSLPFWFRSFANNGLAQVTKGLAAEFGPQKIRVNSVCPLLGATGLFEQFSGVPNTPENQKKFLANVPLGRLAEAEDVANACVFFASDESEFVTGVNLEVDGGRHI